MFKDTCTQMGRTEAYYGHINTLPFYYAHPFFKINTFSVEFKGFFICKIYPVSVKFTLFLLPDSLFMMTVRLCQTASCL